MTPERWRRVQAVFHDAADRTGAERAAFLAAACAGDDALRAEVEGLLAADEAPPGVLADPAGVLRALLANPSGDPTGGDGSLPAPSVHDGQHVGPYRLVREVGRGGMGAVYLAERTDGGFAQRVALKVARDDLAPAQRARFETERQILADLAHPHIARLLDGGLTGAGVPYLVMEYVEGAPLTAYADAHRLPVEARLRLFRQVCDAVHFAHTRLVVHRDLKPSNVLVADGPGGAPVAKLLDFGIARLLAPTGPDPAMTVGAPLTPAYASPEQLRGGALTTASDVYSLGVVLAELLTGTRPDHPDGARVRATGEPTTRPSALVGRARPAADGDASDAETVASARGLTPQALRRRLRGDLDAVVLLALRPEPDRRYPSVQALADDLDRHLAGLPVRARRGTWRYRTGAFVKRHRLGVAAAALALAVVVGGTAYYTARLARERDAARREADRAERVSGFLTDVLAMADPHRPGGAVAPAVLLDSAAARAGALAVHPDTEADVLLTLAGVFERVGQSDRAAPLFEAALARKRRLHGDRHLDVTTLLVRLAEHHANGGRYAAAESLGHRALVLDEALVGPDHPYVAQALNVWAMGLQGQFRFDEADAALRRALVIARRDTSDGFNALSITLNNLARLARERGDARANEAYTREALALRRRLFGPAHPEVANSLVNLAVALGQQRRYAEAEPLFREALALRRRTQGPDHPEIGVDGGGLAGLLYRKGDLAAADLAYRDALAHLQRTLPRGAGATVQVLFERAGLLDRLGRPAEAEAHLRTALADRAATLPAGHWQIAEAEQRLGAFLAAHGRAPEGAALLRGALPALTAAGRPAERFARDARRLLDSLRAR